MKPGVFFSRMKAVMPPRAPLPGSFAAMRMRKSTFGTPETQILRPLMTHSLPSRTARVFICAGSPPAPGSEMAMQDFISPWA